MEIEKYESTARILKIRVYIRGKKEAEVSINIPWALADLALSADHTLSLYLLRW